MTWYDKWYDMIWYDMTWYDMTSDDMTWHDMTQYDAIQYDTTRYNTIWNDMIWYMHINWCKKVTMIAIILELLFMEIQKLQKSEEKLQIYTCLIHTKRAW